MSTKTRYIMELDLSDFSAISQEEFEQIDTNNARELGELLYQADLGTIDDEGLPVESSIREIEDTLSGRYGEFLKSCSLKAVYQSKIIAAVLFTFYTIENRPLLAYTMTHPKFKNMGFCQRLLKGCAMRLRAHGYQSCFLAVSAENIAAVAAYKKTGFKICRVELK